MPAGLPGATPVQNAANPSTGAPVIFDLISGPKGSPKDNDKDYNVITGASAANANASTGGLSTGIGFGPNVGPQGVLTITPSFNDDYVPGVTKPDKTASANSEIIYIGGGKSDAAGKTTSDPAGLSRNVPYTAGFGIGAAGSGGSRDGGAGPAFTGFLMKMVTAVADLANGAVVETGFVNRSGGTVPNTYSQFGSASAQTVAPSMAGEEGTEVEEEGAPETSSKRKLAPKHEPEQKHEPEHKDERTLSKKDEKK